MRATSEIAKFADIQEVSLDCEEFTSRATECWDFIKNYVFDETSSKNLNPVVEENICNIIHLEIYFALSNLKTRSLPTPQQVHSRPQKNVLSSRGFVLTAF